MASSRQLLVAALLLSTLVSVMGLQDAPHVDQWHPFRTSEYSIAWQQKALAPLLHLFSLFPQADCQS